MSLVPNLRNFNHLKQREKWNKTLNFYPPLRKFPAGCCPSYFSGNLINVVIFHQWKESPVTFSRFHGGRFKNGRLLSLTSMNIHVEDIVYVVLLDILSGYHHHNFLSTYFSTVVDSLFSPFRYRWRYYWIFSSPLNFLFFCRFHPPAAPLEDCTARLDIFISSFPSCLMKKYYKTYFISKWNKNGFSWSIGVDKKTRDGKGRKIFLPDSISIQFANVIEANCVCCRSDTGKILNL